MSEGCFLKSKPENKLELNLLQRKPDLDRIRRILFAVTRRF
jgi:hypothetical protein